ncbi:hypothetical protein FACS1894189_7000 [Planctomycetales bacterium]|nr:hypothetical protein FACS1894189_7000 [Planctomycetales bacterium]
MMSLRQNLVLPMVLVAITLGTVRSASAEVVTGAFSAQSIVDAFNSANDGTGLHYTLGSSESGTVQLKNGGNYRFADTSAYHSNRGNDKLAANSFFYTFCVEPEVTAQTYGTATLNYTNGTTKTGRDGNPLTVGAAYLYTMFATYVKPEFYSNTVALGSAIRFLIGDLGTGEDGTNWTNNVYLQNLAAINSQDYWNQIYDPNSFYSEIGNYSVFVMDVQAVLTTGGLYDQIDSVLLDSQDFLYVANAAIPYSPTPEPATMLIFGLGIAGLGLARRKRK